MFENDKVDVIFRKMSNDADARRFRLPSDNKQIAGGVNIEL